MGEHSSLTHSAGMLVVLWSALLLVSPALGGVVWKDPATGKWVEVTEDQLRSDPRMRDSRAGGGDGGDDGDFFGGFAISTQSASQPAAATTTVQIPSSSIHTRDRRSKSSKYSRDIPITENIQTQSITTPPAAPSLEEDESLLVQANSPTTIEAFVHTVPDALVEVSNALDAKNIGNLCRFQGYSPLTGCPKEATNGCVDRIPCQRTCAYDGYFSYRCKGPQRVSLAQRLAQKTPSPTAPQPNTEDYIKSLSSKLRSAIETNDYTSLARLLVSSQQNPRAAAFASSALAQLAHAKSEENAAALPAQTNEPTEAAVSSHVDSDVSSALVPRPEALPQPEQEEQQQQQQQSLTAAEPVAFEQQPLSAPVDVPQTEVETLQATPATPKDDSPHINWPQFDAPPAQFGAQTPSLDFQSLPSLSEMNIDS